MSFAKGDHRYDFEISCPFNVNHKMPKSRLLYHLTKGCMDKQKKGHLFSQCPYDFLHFIRNDLLQYHIQNCKTKKRLEQHTNQLTSKEQQELDDLVYRQFVKKDLDQDIIKPITQQNKNDVNESLPSWSFVVNDLYGNSTDSQQGQTSDFKNNWLSEKEDDEGEFNLIATMNQNQNSKSSDNSFYSVRSEQFQLYRKKEKRLDDSERYSEQNFQNFNLTQDDIDNKKDDSCQIIDKSYRVREGRNQRDQNQKEKFYEVKQQTQIIQSNYKDVDRINDVSKESNTNDNKIFQKDEIKQGQNTKTPKRYDREQYWYNNKQTQQQVHEDDSPLRGYKNNKNQYQKKNDDDSRSRRDNQNNQKQKKYY